MLLIFILMLSYYIAWIKTSSYSDLGRQCNIIWNLPSLLNYGSWNNLFYTDLPKLVPMIPESYLLRFHAFSWKQTSSGHVTQREAADHCGQRPFVLQWARERKASRFVSRLQYPIILTRRVPVLRPREKSKQIRFLTFQALNSKDGFSFCSTLFFMKGAD